MNVTYPIAAVGELLGEPARAAMLVALLDGRARTAGELAFTANISAQSASAHLSKLLDGRLLAVRSVGRHRYYSLTGPEVVHALEAMGSIGIAPPHSTAIRTRAAQEMHAARSCYDHLAGRVAVEVARSLLESRVIRLNGDHEFEIGPRGQIWFSEFGIDVAGLWRSRRTFALQCVDWTERRPHIAGALGAAILSRLFMLGWISRLRNTRALRITHKGQREFRSRFGFAI